MGRKDKKGGLAAPAQPLVASLGGAASTLPLNRASVEEDGRPQWGAALTLKADEKIKRSSSPRGSIIVKDKDTPSDFIFKTLLGEFKDLARKKIEDIMTERIDTISLLSDVFDAAEDPIFSQLVEALSQLSENCVPFLIRALINWKSNQQFLASQTFKPPAGLAKVSAKDTIQVLDERLKLAVEYIFGITLLAVLKHSSAKDTLGWLESGSGLDEDLAAQLETMCFEHFRPGVEKPSKSVDSGLLKALSANRREIPELYAQILGLLSRHRLAQMTGMLFREIGSPSAKGPQLNKSTAMLEGVRYIQLRLDTRQGLDQAHAFVARFFDLYKHKSRTLKTQLSRTIVSIFTPLVKQQPFNPGLDYTAWHSLISSIFVLYSKKIKKSRSIQTWYPLLANLLCLSDSSLFLQQFWPFVETLTKLLKDKANKPIALESLYVILLTYLTKHTEPGEQQTKRLSTITSHIFPPGAWKGQNEVTDTIYIDIIAVIAQKKLDYAINKIIFDLLRSEPFCPERVGIGIQSLLTIVANLETGSGLRDSNSSQSGPHLPQRPPAAIQEYMPTINFCFSSILSTLDKTCGQLTLLHSSKQAQETLQKEKAALHLLRTVLRCIPFCYPTSTSTDKLMNMLARYLIHLDKHVREQALAALTRIMKACPLLRPAVVYGAAEMVLSIPDTNDKLLYHALHKLSNLLHQWPRGLMESLLHPEDAEVFDVRFLPDDPVTGASLAQPFSTSPAQQGFDPVPETQVEMLRHFHPHRVEAVALAFLCLPYPNIRALAVEILQSVRSIAGALSEVASQDDDDGEEELPPTRVMDIIDETGPDVVSRLNQDFVFRMQASPGAGNVKSLERLWSSQSNEDQIFWTYCLGALMPQTLNLCPDAVNTAWHIVCSRMKHVKPEDKSSPVSAEELEHSYAWRNYMVFACSTVSEYACKSVGPGRPRADCWPATVADLFNFILPFLKSDLHCTAVVMALALCNGSAYDVLFETLRPYEQEYTRRRRKGVDQLRNHISYIYNIISETWRRGTLVGNENLRQIYLGYIQETTKYLSQPATESILDNLQMLRCHICMIVGNVARDLSLSGDVELFERAQRKQLFHFLLNWCRGEAMLQDEQTKRQLTSTLGQTRGVEKKKDYEKCVRDQTWVLQRHACAAAASLLLGRVFDEEAVHPNGSVFAWINSLLEQKERKALHGLGRTALEAFLQNSQQYPQLLETAINQCYSTNAAVSRGYFLALVELFKSQDVSHPLPVLFLLIVFKAGNQAIALRRNAIQLLQLVVPENVRYSPLPINSLLDVTYRRSQYELSQLLADQNPDMVCDFTVEMVRRLEMCEARGQRQLLGLLIPWLQCLNRNLHEPNYQPNLELIFENLLLITLQYADDHPLYVQQLWITLADQEENISNVINALLDLGAKKRNPGFLTLAKKVIIWFGREKPAVTVNTLVARLSSLKPATKANSKKSPDSPPSSVRSNGLPSAFSSVMPDIVAYSTPARGHLALIFLAELAFEVSHEFLPHLSVIMHQVFMGFDNPQSVVYEHCRLLLLNLIHSVVVQDIESREERPEELEEYLEATDLEEYLKMREAKQLWINEDISLRRVELASSKELIRLAEQVVKVFARSKVALAEEWATEALTWAISCPSFHLVNRSYQMYRALLPYAKEVKITPIDMLESMLVRIGDRTSENLSVSLEILLTLQAIVDSLDTAKLWLYPQIFWAAIALLHSDFEQEFHLAIKLLTKIVTRFKGFSDIAAQNVFLTYSPKGWEPPFEGVQKLVLRGILSVETLASSVELLSKFIPMQSEKLFEPEPLRLQSNILGLVVYMGLHVGEENAAHECYGMAGALAEACLATSQSKLGKIFSHYRKKQYPNMESFFDELAKAFVEAFFPTHAATAFNFLFDVLDKLEENWKGGSAVAAAGYHKAVLVLLRYLTAEVDLVILPQPKLAKWLSCLARFVTANSSLWKDALRVLECIVHRSELSLSQIFTTNFRPLPYRALRSEFVNQVHKGNARVRDTLKLVLKSADQKEKASLISREFFEWMLKLSPEEEAEEESGAQSPLEVHEDSEEDEIDLTEFQDVFNVFGGGIGAGGGADKLAQRPPRPGGSQFPPAEIDMNDYLEKAEVSPREKEKSGKGEANGKKDKSGKAEQRGSDAVDSSDESAESSNLHGSDEITALGGSAEAGLPLDIRSVSRRWRKLSEQRRFASEADLFEIFPVAGQLLNLFTHDYREYYRAHLDDVPTLAEKRLLQSPVLSADALDLPLFQAPMEQARSVLFSIVCSKYRSLVEANENFSRTFAEKRAQLVEALNQQQRIYLDQKAEVDAKRAKLPSKDPDQTGGPDASRARLQIVQFCMNIVRLHYQLLRLYQINCSLQQLVTGFFDPSGGDESEEAEKQRSLLEKEMDRNTAIARQLTSKERELISALPEIKREPPS